MSTLPATAHDTRNTDPDTSLAAMIKAAKASTEAVGRVQDLMKDGKARTDEEIWKGLRPDYCRSAATIRHARVALSRAKLLVDTGTTRPTTDGGESIVWQIPPPPKGQLRLL